MKKRKPTVEQQLQQAAADPKRLEMLTALFTGPHGEEAKAEFEEMLEDCRYETPEQTRERAKRLYQEFPPYEVWSRSLGGREVAFIKLGFPGPRAYYDWFMGSLAKFAGLVQ
jgi:hypothetical protein